MCAIYKYHLRVYHIGEGHLTKFPWLKCLRLRSAVPINSLTCRLDHVTEIGTCRLGAISWILFTEIRKTHGTSDFQIDWCFLHFQFQTCWNFLFSNMFYSMFNFLNFCSEPWILFSSQFRKDCNKQPVSRAPYPKVGGGSSRGDTEVRNHHHDLRFESLGSHD